MKLHRLEVENLASLYGRHVVDLDGELAGADLFLIVGSTGAGKSTLLDSVSLALFGATPRLPLGRGTQTDELSSGDSRLIMSHGTGSCRAALVFSKVEGDGERRYFRAEWSVRRARDRADGRVQEPQRSLESVTRDGERIDLLTSDHRKSVIEPVFEEVLEGLTLEDFQRSVLLAQGEFAAFLRATPAERAGILERLTSTEIYKEIGRRAAEARRVAFETVKRIEVEVEAIRPLSDDEQAELEAERNECASRGETLDKELETWRRASDLLSKRQTAIKETDSLSESRNFLRAERATISRTAAPATARADVRKGEAKMQLSSAADELAKRAASEGLVDELPRLEERVGERLAMAKRAEAERKRRHAVARDLKTTETAQKEMEQGAQTRQAAQGEAEAAHSKAVEALAKFIEDKESPAAHRAHLEADREAARALVQGEQDLERLDTAASTASKRLEELDQTKTEAAKQDVELAGKLDRVESNLERLPDLIASERRHRDTLNRALALTDYRETLVDGEACPLCGSTDHPMSSHDAEAEAADADELRAVETRLDELEAERGQLEARGRSLGEERQGLASRIEAHDEEAKSLRGRLAELENERSTLIEQIGLDRNADEKALARAFKEAHDSIDARTLEIERLDRTVDAERTAETALALARTQVTEHRSEITRLETEARQQKRSLAELDERILDLENDRRRLSGDLVDRAIELGLIESEMAPSEEPGDDWFDARLEEAVEGGRRATAAWRRATEKHRAAEARASSAERVCSEAESLVRSLVESTSVDPTGVDSEAGDEASDVEIEFPEEESEALAWLRSLADRHGKAEGRLLELDGRLAELSTLRQGLDEEIEDLRVALAFESIDKLAAETPARLSALESQRAELQKRLGSIEARLDEQRRALERLGSAKNALKEARTEQALWNELHTLIGVNDGDEFKKFAQILNLQELIERANARLEWIEPRYALALAGEEKDGLRQPTLGFSIRDGHLAGVERPLSTLSGGETFLVSLALALGLADYRTTTMPIETLLLDEGFGSLDAETLETAMAALERIRSTGTQVGIISHVDALKERIEARVVVEKLGDGRSNVRLESGRTGN